MSNNDANTNSYYTPRQIRSSFTASVSEAVPSETEDLNKTETQTTSSFIFDLKKYKHEYLISKLSCTFDPIDGKFASPTGICTLPDDRLLVGNYDRNSLLLLDINGVVYEIYKNLPAPKDVLYDSSNPLQAVVATKKAVVILDLNTKTIVAQSKIQGFYPWNLQYMKEDNIFAACDPSSERIVFLDKNLNDIGSWSFNDRDPNQLQGYHKVYPYTAHFFHDNTSVVLIHREEKCQLGEYDTASRVVKKIFNIPPAIQSYSIYVDSERKCLIADKMNHRLISVSKDSEIEEFKWKSIQEPYSMAFLSTGTLCVTTWNKSLGSYGGLAVMSEMDLQTIE